MTVVELAGAVAVVKNLLLTKRITPIRACMALWNLVDEVGDSMHYRRGSSVEVDKLLAELGLQDRMLESISTNDIEG